MADKVVGVKLQVDSSEAISSVKSFKQQLREAEKDVISLSEKFGATSKEAQNAAKRAAELKDTIGDSKSLIDAFNPDQKFRALSQSLNGVLGGFTALTGAMGLLGVESEDTQKMLLKVQSAMALSQGLNQVGDAIQSFKNLGTVIKSTTLFQNANNAATVAATTIQKAFGVSVVGTGRAFTILKGAIAATGIGLLLVGIGMLVDKLMSWSETTDDVTDSQDRLNNSLERQKELMDEELNRIDWLTKMRIATAKKNGASEKELTQITVDGARARIAEYENERNRLTAIRKDGTQWAKLDFKEREKLLNDEVAANKALIEERKKLQLSQAEAEAADAQRARSLRKTGGASTVNEKYETTKTIDKLTGSIAEQTEQERLNKIVEFRKDFNSEIGQLDDERFLKSENLLKAGFIVEENMTNARIQLTEEERAAKVQAAQSIGGALGALSDLVGRQTAAGKVLGIAQATINTFIGASEVLRAKSTIPEPFGTISKIANVAAIIATGLSTVKNIVKVKVPGAAGGSAPSVSGASIQAAVTPQAAQSTRTTLDQNQLNQIGNATVRAFVVESDMSNSQERIRRLNRAARL